MAAVVRARAPWNVRIDEFRNWEPEGDLCVGVILAHFYHLWHEAEGGGVTNYASADRLSEYLPPDWSEWARFLLNEMSIEDEDFGPALLDFPGYIHILLTRWIYPPGHQHPFDLGDGVVNLVAPPPQGNPAPPGRAPSSPPVPPHTPPHAEPPTGPNHGTVPIPNPWEPVYEPHGLPDLGYTDPLAMHLAPPHSPDRHTPPPPQPPYRRTARISTITSIGETFRFTILDQVSAEFLGESHYSSGSWGSSTEGTSSTYSGDTSGSDDTWFSGSDSSDDVPNPEAYHVA